MCASTLLRALCTANRAVYSADTVKMHRRSLSLFHPANLGGIIRSPVMFADFRVFTLLDTVLQVGESAAEQQVRNRKALTLQSSEHAFTLPCKPTSGNTSCRNPPRGMHAPGRHARNVPYACLNRDDASIAVSFSLWTRRMWRS